MKLPKVYRRPVYDEILERAHEPRRFIQVLAGPRQVLGDGTRTMYYARHVSRG